LEDVRIAAEVGVDLKPVRSAVVRSGSVFEVRGGAGAVGGRYPVDVDFGKRPCIDWGRPLALLVFEERVDVPAGPA
jgi:hypothetical protein